jgi:prepilin-type N-terminal cleavage/methylation domain-containing protein
VRSPNFSPRSGFTLIELLTVIAIIGILAAILIPTVGRVRDSARMTRDVSNLREIGKGIGIYWSESRNTMPISPLPGNPSRIQAGEERVVNGVTNRFPVYETIDRYIARKPGLNPSGQYQYQQNPVWFAAGATIPDGATSATQPYGNFANFSFNPYIWRFDAGQGRWHGRMSNVPAPSRTVLMAETNDPFGIGDDDFDPNQAPVFERNVSTKYRLSQPGQQGLYLWADLHVSSMRGDQGVAVNPTIWRWWNLP